MAQKAKKELAKANEKALNRLHSGTIALHLSFIFLGIWVKGRSSLTYVLLSFPSLIAEAILEKSGRPKYDGQTLKSSGEDLNASGLTEYMFDIVWTTWASLVAVVVLGNWGWLLFAIVPVFGLYKGLGFLGMAKTMLRNGNAAH